MGKNLIGNNCGLLYKDIEGNLLLVSVSPCVLSHKDIIEVYHEDRWVNGRIEHNGNERDGYFLFDMEETNQIPLRTGMKIRIPKSQG
ncbi:MAG TPA: DUF5348 domain-containing protein [Thermodesulfovibrionia bacterium]|nr:DUF5348 domain-containing protein [Thermodesulfovibrionia bacterium]